MNAKPSLIPSGPDGSPATRLPGLDLMRATAVSLVVLQHSFDLVLVPPESWRHWIYCGHLGVDIFFVLSGFLVGGMVLRAGAALTQPQVMAGFLIGRWMRTLPLYYFILLVRQLLRVTIYQVPLEPWSFLGRYVVFMQNLAWPMPAYFIESWSLAVEEWFYLLLPFLVWAGIRAGLRSGTAFGLGAFLLLMGPMVLRFLSASPTTQNAGINHIVVQRLDAIAWGVITAAIASAWPKHWWRRRSSALVVGLALVAGCYAYRVGVEASWSPWVQTIHPSLVSLGIALILPWASTTTALDRGWMRPVTRIALWSYSIYLTNLLIAGMLYIHVTLARPGAELGERLGWLAGFWLLTIIISAGLYRWIESPLMRRRKQLGIYRAFTAAIHR